MGNNVIIGIVIAIIIVALIAFLVSYLMKKKNQDRLDALEKRKEELFDLPVIEEVDDVKKMHLVGQSQNTFREWSQKWNDISTSSFAELESQIFEVENLNESFRFLKGKKAVVEAEKTMDQMEKEVSEIREGLKELRETEERNSLAVQQALDVYEELKETIKEDEQEYGPALPELQKQVKMIENEFTQFVALNTSGDPVEAREVLDKAEKHTYEVEALMKKIPPLFEDLNTTFPEQLEEINSTYEKLMQEQYVFPEDDLVGDIKKVSKRIEHSLATLEKTEVETVEFENRETASMIDALYDVLEREMEAQNYVATNQATIEQYIKHATKNNRQLLIELDHTAQSYALNHNEIGRVRGFQTEVEEIERQNEQMKPQMQQLLIPFSEVRTFYKKVFKVLEDIENQQVEIDDSLHELRKGEQEAQEKIDVFEFKLRNLKRFVEQQRLPGLPKDYLEFFFVATDRIEELSIVLNKIRVNMEEVNQLVALCEEDLELLDKKTHDLVDAAALTEQMLQYANRYRHTHEEIKEAIDKSFYLFNKEYRYQEALDEIGTALERVEPGAFKRIEDFYFKNPDLV
ncbi:septation ring formation regulator EzrA [Enterococcus villorum]|uniref:Septation ring formation regulator EzrA n=2 Tax=Enterococcus villorum TaxID=112904 RepID=A0A511J4I3_9ENTE|nr:septation ring formation regulator EzrA [Enterococcus villorum]EOH85946.1 septation ring formation regulator EzrA [Enterococcus villorum ATCC 700913]EOW78475.1 septation ring formation regulator EzrA [Enterococcus villorum ATCC 700913]GEL92599.1 septation ring formation regulator EzrA [Enterococcus villorum]